MKHCTIVGFLVKFALTFRANVYLLLNLSSAAHYSGRYTKFFLFHVQFPAELYIVDIWGVYFIVRHIVSLDIIM